MRSTFLLLSLILLTGVSCDQQTEEESGIDGPIDRTLLLEHVEVLASDAYMGRRTGTEGGRLAREYVLARYKEIGLAPACGDSLGQSFSFENRRYGTLTGTNFIGKVAGTGSSDGSIIVTAHFDHLGDWEGDIFNGADDNASGTSTLIELARVLLDDPPTHDVLFAALDAEEMGLQGARAFVESSCFEASDIRLNLNMDMVSRNEAGELWASGTYHNPFLKEILEALPTAEGLTIRYGHDGSTPGEADWTSASDHGPFHGKGVPFIYFGVEDHAGYHTFEDDFADITPEFFYDAASYILDATRAMDASLDAFPE